MTAPTDDEPTPEPSSPACLMHEADDSYMGYVGRDELVAFLNELLEAERAGARITLESAQLAGDTPVGALLRDIQQDEAHWCAMLLGHLRSLNAAPSPKVGAFYDKAAAIAELDARVTFINRGQRWVVHKLCEMMPRLRDAGLRSNLEQMLRSHEANIALVDAATGAV